MALKRKNVMVDEEKLRDLAKRLGMNESEAIRYAVDGLLHSLEIEEMAEQIRKRGGLDDVFGRTGDGPRRARQRGSARRKKVAGAA